MTIRAFITGFLLAVFISVFTYFNDNVIRQTYFIGNHLPIGIFGVFLVLVFLVNPLLRRISARLPFKPLELVVVTALGLVACGWPGSSYSRGFSQFIAMPAHLYETKANWKAARLMNYVPGGSPLLGEGHVIDWMGFVSAIEAADTAATTPSGRLKSFMPVEGRLIMEGAVRNARLSTFEKNRLLDNLNLCISNPAFYSVEAFSGVTLPAEAKAIIDKKKEDALSDRETERLNRLLLVSAFPGVILPSPPGKGVLLEDGQANAPAVVSLLQGWEGSRKPGITDLPWKAWLPTVWFWGCLTVLIGICSVLIIVIVQPQWKKELLPYPIARFVHDLVEPSGQGSLPKIARNRLFWYAFAIMIVLHLVNGLQKWFPKSIMIPMNFEFFTFFEVLPTEFLNANLFSIVLPYIYPTVIAFTFFLNTQVSFSVAISGWVYALVYFMLVKNGVAMTSSTGDSYLTVMRFGSYFGAAIMMLYIGRSYYVGVLKSSLGLHTADRVVRPVYWALRILVLCIAAMVVVLTRNGIDWQLGTILVLLILVNFTILARINAETGIFFNQPLWMPVTAIAMTFGINALGPTTYFMLYIISMVFTHDVREAVTPFIGNSVFMVTDRQKPLPSGRFLTGLGAIVTISFLIALGSVIFMQYRFGLNYADGWMMSTANQPYDRTANAITELSSYDELATSVNLSGFRRLAAARPDVKGLGWVAAGILLVIGCSVMRTRFAWWPIHPVMFLVFGTFFPGNALIPSIMIGWLIKAVVIRFSGARGFHSVKPFMIGIIAGELSAALGWIIVGAAYYYATGIIPKSYSVFWGAG